MVLLPYFWRQLTKMPQPVSSIDLTGKTVLVTGGSMGLGFETCRQLLELGASRLILTSRSPARAAAAIEKMRPCAKPGTKIDFYTFDLLEYDSIFEFVDGLKKDGVRLDIVLLCAGIRKFKMEAAPTGREATLQVNHVSISLLALLLLPLINKGGKLTTASSETHAWSPFPERHEKEIVKTVGSMNRSIAAQYDHSKLLNLLWQRELAARADKSDVVVNYVNPGLAATTMAKESTGVERVMLAVIVGIFARPAPVGARTFTDAVTRGPDSHGRYCCGKGIEIPLAKFIETPEGKEVQQRIWDETLSILKDETGGRDIPVPAAA